MHYLIHELAKETNKTEPMYLFSWEVEEAKYLHRQGRIELIPDFSVISGFKARLTN